MQKALIKLVQRINSRLTLTAEEKYRRYIFSFPRYSPQMIKFLNSEIKIADSMSFWSAYHAIFIKNDYDFIPSSDSPTIIDGGANIGLASIYFAHKFPACRLISFEPDTEIFDILKENISKWGNGNIQLINKGLWSTKTSLTFSSDGADGGRIDAAKDSGKTIETTVLSEHLNDKVDLLKLDIEGAEIEVLKECQSKLNNVDNLIVEYHSFKDNPQHLSDLITIFEQAGFRIYISPETSVSSPLINRQPGVMDMQLNIFGYRI